MYVYYKNFFRCTFFKAMASVNLSLYYVKVGTIFKKLRDYFNLAKLSVSVAYVLTILMYSLKRNISIREEAYHYAIVYLRILQSLTISFSFFS